MSRNARVTLILAAKNTAGKALRQLKGQTRSLGQQLRNSLGAQLMAALSITTVIWQIKSLTNETIKLQNALTGLQVISQSFGRSAEETRKAAERLAKDGLITVGEAAKSMQNLLSTGFNIEEAERMIQATKAAAAFNRQAGLQFGEAVVRATEGVRMGMSTLSDAAGIATNLATMLKRHGIAPAELSNLQQSSEARQAIFTEWINDANAEMENLNALLNTAQGEMLQMEAASRRQREEIGATLMDARLFIEDITTRFWQLIGLVARFENAMAVGFAAMWTEIEALVQKAAAVMKTAFGRVVSSWVGMFASFIEKVNNVREMLPDWMGGGESTTDGPISGWLADARAWGDELARSGEDAIDRIDDRMDLFRRDVSRMFLDALRGSAGITVPDTNASGRDRSSGGRGVAAGSVTDPRVALATSINRAAFTAPAQVAAWDRQAMAQRFLDQLRGEMDRVGLTVDQLSGDLRDRLRSALKTAGLSVEDFSGAVDGIGDTMELTADQIIGTIGNIGHTLSRMSQGKVSGLGGFGSIAGALSGIVTGGLATAFTAASVGFGFADALASTGHREAIREGVGMAIEDHQDKFNPAVTLVTEGRGSLASMDRLEDMLKELQRRGSSVVVRANR